MGKNQNWITAIAIIVVMSFGLTNCTKEKIETPTVKVYDGAITLSFTSAGVTAEVTDQGGAEVKSRGFAYGLSGSAMDTVFCGSGTGVYSAELSNLRPNTTYVYEAFAKNAGGTGTSGKVTFTTRDNELPTVKTVEVENVGTTTASCGGNVTNDGGANVTERGVCWGTNHNPIVSGSHASAGSGLGEYTCSMNNLSANTTYYVRAYAKNSKGVAYGEEKSFTTLDFDLPEVTTADVTNIAQTTAKGGGTVTSDGGTAVTERGVCWSTSHNPTVSGSHTASGTGTGDFTCDITNLTASTLYYVRAYAKNSKGTVYGEEVSFTTLAIPPDPPTVSTGSVTNITTTSATGSGNVTHDGGSAVTERGLCWGTSHNPTISGQHIAAGSGTGNFTETMTHLTVNTKYYVRAYATNSVGTSYGDEVEFTTLTVSVPGVTTANVTNIGNNSATGGGNVVSDGGATVTECGICWSTSHNPTISGSHATGFIQSGTGSFIVNMTNLTANTTYYVRAYAINSQGTGYGEEVEFKTSQTPTYIVSVSANPSNGGTVTGGGTFQQGQSCTVSATAATGYNFLKWTENGQQVSTNASYTFNVTGNRTLVAQFQTQSYTISASASPSNGGTVSGGGTYGQGQQCTLTANHATGYTFVKWTENGNQVSTSASFTFTVTSNRTLVAQFNYNNVGGHEYVDLGLPSGLLWATCNVGADTPEDYGNYYAWAETTTKTIYNWSTYQYCMGSDNTLTKYCPSSYWGYNGYEDNLWTLQAGDDAATANWSNGWRMPTVDEFQELCNNTTMTWTTRNGVNGCLFTAANGNSLFLPAAGYRSGSNLNGSGSYGSYWSSNLYDRAPFHAWGFGFNSANWFSSNRFRYYGQSVRAVHSAN